VAQLFGNVEQELNAVQLRMIEKDKNRVSYC